MKIQTKKLFLRGDSEPFVAVFNIIEKGCTDMMEALDKFLIREGSGKYDHQGGLGDGVVNEKLNIAILCMDGKNYYAFKPIYYCPFCGRKIEYEEVTDGIK